jgi:class 3 adenylate cyclase
MLSPKAKADIYRILPFGLIWFLFSLVYTLLEKGFIGDLSYYPSTGNPYNFGRNVFITPLSAFITGLLIGTIEILYLSKLFIRKSFSKKIFYKSIIYITVILFFLVVTTAIVNAIELRVSAFNVQVVANVRAFLSHYSFISVGVYMAAIIFVSQFYTEVSESLGLGVLSKFFLGKYHTPVEEERIFMFLDMKSSTSIAEGLGHLRYFEMLREYYADLSAPVINYSGEIYQYVGDELVISWTLSNGLGRNNCIRCFFAMKAALGKQAAKYQQMFGLVPEFKAGFHFGKVTTGEIGIIKKEIIFTGDVLNSTARIQGLCNDLGVDILISADLLQKLKLAPRFKVKSMGENELKGRDEKIELFTIVPA